MRKSHTMRYFKEQLNNNVVKFSANIIWGFKALVNGKSRTTEFPQCARVLKVFVLNAHFKTGAISRYVLCDEQ